VAQRTTVVLTDDVDGGEATETVQFGLDGVSYEIDLTAANAEKLRRSVELYVENARRSGGRRSGAAAPASPVDGVDSTAVRAWAKENGIEVSERGRLKADVVQQFKDAGN
jgi:hypothetical protein